MPLVRSDLASSLAHDEPQEYLWTMNFGPQHPATHTTLRLVLKLDGERVVDAMPDIDSLPRAKAPDSQYVLSVVTTSLGIFWRSATSSKPMASHMPTRPILPEAML